MVGLERGGKGKTRHGKVVRLGLDDMGLREL